MKGVDDSIPDLVIIFAAYEVLNAVPHQHHEDGEEFQQIKVNYAFFLLPLLSD